METDFSIFKYPRGFIKILELLFAILGFAVLAGYRGKGSLTVMTVNDTQTDYTFKVKYSFGSSDYQISTSTISASPSGYGSSQSDAQFMVAVGVLSFLYALAMCLCYSLLEVRLNPLRLKIFYSLDFAVTAVLAFFWLVAGGVWARGSDGVIDNVNGIYNTLCTGAAACVTDKPNYAGIIAAVAFGFLNFFIWTGNGWFTFKETPFFKWKKGPATATPSSSETATPKPATETEVFKETKPMPESTQL